MKLQKEDYKKANNCLKNYNYNCIRILNIRFDIMSVNGVNFDGMPKAPYKISDTVLNSVIKLQEDKELMKAIEEYKIVQQALALVCEDSQYIFKKYYVEGKGKWDIINKLNVSEETYKRRKRELIYTVDKELKKLTQN